MSDESKYTLHVRKANGEHVRTQTGLTYTKANKAYLKAMLNGFTQTTMTQEAKK